MATTPEIEAFDAIFDLTNPLLPPMFVEGLAIVRGNLLEKALAAANPAPVESPAPAPEPTPEPTPEPVVEAAPVEEAAPEAVA